MIILVTVCVLLLAAVVYLAVSRRSSFKVRIAALAALSAMIITVVICLYKIFMTPAVAKVQALPDQPPPPPPPPPNAMALVLFIVVLAALFLVVMFLSIREQRRITKEDKSLSKLGL